MQIEVVMRHKIKELFAEVTLLCSVARLYLEEFSSVIASNTYSFTALLTQLAATEITELVFVRLQRQEVNADETRWEQMNMPMAS